jgi:antitoxin component of MazEF toxin-antitoxin module
MTQLTIIHHGEAAAVVLPAAVLDSIGLRIGDVLEATLGERQLILRLVEDAARREAFEAVTKDVFEQRRDAYERLA